MSKTPGDRFSAAGWVQRLLSLLLCLAVWPSMAAAQEDAKQAPLARLIPLASPIADQSIGLVRRNLLELQDIAAREDRQAFLILEVEPGISEFHHCYALADLLSSQPLGRVSTLAWVPTTVTGNNVLPALACREIVLAPDASLGDMGSGKALMADQQTIVRGIVARRRNAKVTESLAQALMDPAVALVQLTVETDGQLKETRLATEAEAKALRDQGQIILDSRTISESGTPALISGAQARAQDLLATRIVGSRRELLDSYGVTLDALKELAPAKTMDRVAYIELHDEIDEIFAAFAERQIDRAVQSGAKLIIFDIDSPGGYLWVCQDLSMKIAYLSERDVKTVAYIPKEAYSGGAILAVGCDEIYMKPDAVIGNAIPIKMMGNVVLHAEAKALSSELKLLRDLAKLKNRPAALLEGFADEKLEIYEATHKTTGRKWFMSQDEVHNAADEWTQGPRVPESRPGIALTVNGIRAHELLIAQPPVQGVEELKQRLGIPADFKLQTVGRTWVDTLVFVLNRSDVAAFLFFVAIVSIYIEMATMTGLFGIISAVCFSIFFWSKMMGGTATGLEVALFLIGAACLALEIFVMPGFGVFGVTGILLVLGSLIMASQTFTGFDLQYDLARTKTTFATLGIAIVGVIVASSIISKYLPRIPFLREMVLIPPGADELSSDGPRLRPDLSPEEAAILGGSGVAVTILRPAGKARIDGRLLDVVSDGPFIEEGTNVTVVQVAKNRIVVRAS